MNKPTIRPSNSIPDQATIKFPCGGTGLVFKPIDPRAIRGISEWCWEVTPENAHAAGDDRQLTGRADTSERAISAAWIAVHPSPPSCGGLELPLPDAVEDLDRNAYNKLLRKVLKLRTGRNWSVKGSTGTAWCWITVSAIPSRLENYRLSAQDQAELSGVFGTAIHGQGESIPPTRGYRAWYLYRAAGASTDQIEKREHSWANN